MQSESTQTNVQWWLLGWYALQYLRVGRWHDAVVSNKQALETDEKDAAQ